MLVNGDKCYRGIKTVPFPPLLSCELSVSVKESHDRKKKAYKIRVCVDFKILLFFCTSLLLMKISLVLKTMTAEAATRGVP